MNFTLMVFPDVEYVLQSGNILTKNPKICVQNVQMKEGIMVITKVKIR